MARLLGFDNGVKGRFAVIVDGDETEARRKWNWLVDECTQLIPGLEGDYKTFDSPVAILEQINLGSFIKDLPQQQKDCIAGYFPCPEVLFHVMQEYRGKEGKAIDYLDREISVIMDALKYLFFNLVDRSDLIKRAVAWRKEYPCHSNASNIPSALKNWEQALKEGGDKGGAFETLTRNLAWHILMSHEWLVAASWENVSFPVICQFEHDIVLRLLHSYLMQIEDGANLSGAHLFSRLERLKLNGKFPQSKKELEHRPRLFKKDKELLDSDLSEFLVTGYWLDKQRHSVVVITCDRKKQKERLEVNIRGIKQVNKLLDDRDLKGGSIHKTPARIPIHPGVLVVVDQNSKKPTEKIDVQELMADLEAENAVNKPELQMS